MVQLRHVSVGKLWVLFLLAFLCVVTQGQQRKIDPTYLQRYVPDVPAKASDLSTETCRYKPIFGWGDAASAPTTMRGVVRFGELTIEAHGSCKEASYAAEEQAWVVMTGAGQLHYGGETSAVKARDFFYIPATVTHSISNDGGVPVQLLVMGFKNRTRYTAAGQIDDRQYG
jgi:mannose-6-phosphate isomerase-like protein (cupin superfamily)